MRAGAVPVLLVMGRWGAGKTSLIARWLAHPALSDAVAITTGVGDEGVDHLLLPRGTRHAPTGALADALAGLAHDESASAHGRVIVECGAGDAPASLAATLEEDERLRERFALHGIVTVVDALDGAERLASDPVARSHVAIADALVIAKADMTDAPARARLTQSLLATNPDAAILPAGGDAAEAWSAAAAMPGRELRRLRAEVEAVAPEVIGSHCVVFERPIELSGFCVGLAGFLEAHAGDVVRVKGLVAVAGRRGPALIQAVGTTLYPVRTLKEWPDSAGRRSMLCVAARGLAGEAIRAGIAPARSRAKGHAGR